MKNTFNIIAAVFVIVAAASCSKEPIFNNTPGTEGELVHMTFSAALDPESKTTLASDRSVHWTDEDAIGVYYMDRNYLKYNSESLKIRPESNDSNPTQARFSGNVVSSSTYYGVFPAKGWSVQSGASDDYLCFDGLRNQNAVLDSFDPEKHISITAASDNNLVFKNACALAKIKIGSSNVYSVKIEGNVTSSGNGAYSEGSIGGNLWFKQGKFEVYRAIKNNNHNSITLTNANGSALKNGGVYYIVLPPCKVGNFKVSVCDISGNVLHSMNKGSEFNIERNKVYDLGEFKVPKKYSANNKLQRSSQLAGGGQYIIRLYSNEDYVWTNDNGKLVLTEVKDGVYTEANIFNFYIFGNPTGPSGEQYSSDRGGRFQSVSNQLFIDSNLNITTPSTDAGNAQVFYFGSQWGSQDTPDIDIYKNNTNYTLYRSGLSLGWKNNTSDNDNRKWVIYEAKVQ